MTSVLAGSYPNDTESVISSLGTSTAAEATLTVDPAVALGFAKAFSPARVDPGGISRLTFTIDNAANAIAVGSLAFTDAFPDGMTVAATPNAETGCGGTFAPAASATSLAFTGGSVASGEACTIAVDVQALRAGTLENRSGALTSAQPFETVTPGATATLTVDAAPLSVSMAFSPRAIVQGGVSRLTHTLDNGAAVEATSVALSDRLPAGVAVADPPDAQTTCIGGRLTAAAGTREIAYSDGALAAGASCTIAVDVTSATAARYRNIAQSVTSSLGTSTAVSAGLRVEAAGAPGFARVFAPDSVRQGGETQIVFTVDNTANLIEVGSLAFTNAFPDGLVVADAPSAENGCEGRFDPVAGATTLAFADGVLAAGATCEIRVTVRAIAAGTLTGPAVTLTSNLAPATAAEATLTVDPAEAPGFARVFAEDSVRQGGETQIVFTVDNTANLIEVGSLAFTDAFPDGLVVADAPSAENSCEGRFDPVAGATTLAFAGGVLAAGATCEIRVTVRAIAAGTLTVPAVTLTSNVTPATAAEAMLTVDPAEAPGFARVFAEDSVRQGGETQIVFTLDNTANLIDLGELAFTDAFPDGLVVADAPNATTACGGTFSPVAGATTLAFADGALAAGATCEIRVTLRAIGAGRLTVPAVTLTSNLAPATAAEARLDVTPAGAPGFAKAFSPARVDQGGMSRLTFTIDNAANLIEVGSLAFTDAFPDGLVMADPPNAENSCGGTFAPVASAVSLAFSGGSVAAGQTCTIAVDVQALRAGGLENTSGALASDLPVTTPGATATLTVDEPSPLSVSMTFLPPAIAQGGVSRLTYTLDNGTAIGATSVALSDTLPADVAVADPPDAQTTCAGGTLTAAAGSEAIAYSDGVLAAGASCTIAVDVTSATAGSYRNITESVTSSLGTSTAAEARLTVAPAEAPGFARVFAPDSVRQGGETQIVFTLDNTANLIEVGSLAFTDAFPDGLVVADAPSAENSCGGTFSPIAGATTLAFADGALAAGATCEIRVTLRAIGAGALTVPAVTLRSNLAPATAAEARLDVTPAAAPGFAKAFSPARVAPGGISRLTFTIDNAASSVAVGGLAFTDAFPDGMTVAATPNAENSCGGTFAPAASAASLAFSGGSVASGEACTIALDVQALRAGTLENRSSALASDLPVTTPGAGATLTVDEDPLTASMSFTPETIDQGGVSRLTYTLDNGAAVEATGVALSDRLPANVVVADPPAAQTSCGGTLTAAAGSREIAYSEGALAAGASCTIAVDMTSATVGSYPNNLQTVTSSLGASAAVSARLTVTPAEAPGFARVFDPDSVRQGGETQIVFTLDNGANLIDLRELAFTDAFPDGLVVADAPSEENGCGGTFSPAAGDDRLAFTGGTLAAGATCEIRVTLRAIAAGRLTVPAVTLTSNLAPATAAEARLDVDPTEAPGFTKRFFPRTIVAPGRISTLIFTIDNTANAIAVGSLAFTDAFPDGMVVSSFPRAQSLCGGTFSPVAGATTLTFSGGRVAAGATCTIAVNVRALRAGTLENRSGALASDLPVTTSGATATLRVDETPLTVSMAFSPPAIAPGGISRLTYTLDSGATVGATSVALSDRLPAAVVLADPPAAQTTCSGGRLTAAAGSREIAYSDGALATFASCTIAVDVTSATAGSYPNETESVTSSLGTSTAAEATLTVKVVEAPGFARVFAPDRVAQGGETQIVFTLDNTANAVDLRELAFTDAFPDGLVVADAPSAENSCGGTFSPIAGAATLAFADGALAAGATCEIRVTLRAIGAGRLTVPAVTLTSNLAPATAAEATLTVDPAEAPGFAKAFSPARVEAGGISRLTYTIDNSANAIEVTGLAFSDTFQDGLIVADPSNVSLNPLCGAVLSGNRFGRSQVSLSEGTLAARQTCTLSINVQAVRPGVLTDTSGVLTSDLPVSTPGATATLTVDEAPLSVSMAFSPPAIAQGGVSRLTYTLDNGAAIRATLVALSDSLPAGVVVADPPNAETSCGSMMTFSTLAAAAGGDSIIFTEGLLAADASCTIAVDVTSAAAGSYANETESVTSSLGTSTPAEATLTVTMTEPPLSVSMAFEPPVITAGGVSRLTYTLRNGAAIGATSVVLSDSLPAAVALADPPDAQTTCSGGTLTAAAGTREIAYSEGALAADASCTIAVDVTSATVGSYPNGTESVTSSLGTSTPAEATLTVDETLPLSVSMSFSPARIMAGGVSRLSYVLRNAGTVEATSIVLFDSLPNGVVVADEQNIRFTDCSGFGGSVNAVPGGTSFTWRSFIHPAGRTCTISLDVTSALVGSHPNGTENVTSSLGTSTAAEATLTVDPAGAPGFAKAFSPARVAPGGISRLTFTIDNAANLIAVGSLAFTDDFPDGLVAADPPNGSTACGGTFAPAASAASLAFTGGSVAAGQTCTLAVDVRALRAGALANLSGALASDLLVTTPGAGATLTVDEAPLTVSMAFSPPAIAQGGVSRLTHTLRNGAAVEATSVVAVRQSARRCGAGRPPRCADDLRWRYAGGGGGG